MTVARSLCTRLRSGWSLALACAGVLALAALPVRAEVGTSPAVPSAFTKDAPESVRDLKDIEDHVKILIQRVMPAVVAVQIGPRQGSGVIVSAEGHVLTAGHVSGSAGDSVMIILPDGRRLKGKTLGSNRGIDSGMIQIERSDKDKRDFAFVDMANSHELRRGQWCLALGHPGGYQKGRTPPARLGRILEASDRFIRTDCTLVGGDSGGPLFDMSGRVIGIHSRIGPTLTANVHVPVDTFRETWERLSLGEVWGGSLFGTPVKRGAAYLGIKVSPEAPRCLIDEVMSDSPAQKAGLQMGDIITMCDGKRIRNIDELTELLQERRPGAEVSVEVLRGGEAVTFRVTLAKRPAE